MKNDKKGKSEIKPGTIAVISDGSAVFGLGNIGAREALPFLIEKTVLFKEFGDVGAFPVCLGTSDPDEIVKTIKNIAPGFAGICLEGISAPQCFDIEKRLRAEAGIPVFHDDQHGTAIAVCAGVINAFRLSGKALNEAYAVVCGAGAAGSAIAKLLFKLGVRDVVVCDSKGILSAKRIPEFGEDKLDLLEFTNKEGISGSLEDATRGCDLFVGASRPGILTGELVKNMAEDPVIFAIAEPEPEIGPEAAKAAGAFVVGTGKQGFPNQINRVLVFPGVFKGALAAGATDVTDEMKAAAAYALAGLVSDEELNEECVLPLPGKEGLTEAVAKAVRDAWIA